MSLGSTTWRFSLRQHLAAGEGRDGVGVPEVQLEVHNAAVLKSLLGAVRDEVPNPGVQNMDGAKEARWRVSLYGPQEGIQLTLLKGNKTTSRHDTEGQKPERRKWIRETSCIAGEKLSKYDLDFWVQVDTPARSRSPQCRLHFNILFPFSIKMLIKDQKAIVICEFAPCLP